MGAGFVMMLLALAAYRDRHVIGRFQANVLWEAFNIGEDRQPEIAAGLAAIWAAMVVLLLICGLAIGVAGSVALPLL
ncbi:hypothetical protein D6T63_00150 [Arthrobacter cheniae]|uniref:Uncharacterized protein n=1 Tax=Arthrobacter cheniae TaxID=1258888 RepID=A0A3A5MH63_9MICC|nr:hypothetical protein [Arthrobacter cheniae]RJT82916.1 hypothetical protein D6T63_00150 [Arthrobacter cheniae]